MARPDYVICMECEAEVDEFTWRGGEIRAAECEVCGNNDPDAFALPEEYADEFDEDDPEDLDVGELDLEDEYEEKDPEDEE